MMTTRRERTSALGEAKDLSLRQTKERQKKRVGGLSFVTKVCQGLRDAPPVDVAGSSFLGGTVPSASVERYSLVKGNGILFFPTSKTFWFNAILIVQDSFLASHAFVCPHNGARVALFMRSSRYGSVSFARACSYIHDPWSATGPYPCDFPFIIDLSTSPQSSSLLSPLFSFFLCEEFFLG